MLKAVLILWTIACGIGLIVGFMSVVGIAPELPAFNLLQGDMGAVPAGVLKWLLMWGLGVLIIFFTTLYFRAGRKMRGLRKWTGSLKSRLKIKWRIPDLALSMPSRTVGLLRRARYAIAQRLKRKSR